MLAIHNAVLRFFAVANIQAVKERLSSLCRRQTQLAQEAKPVDKASAEEEIREDDLYPAFDDTEDRFAAWEAEQNEKLHEAETLEQQGLALLSKAALLRAAIKCDNRADTFVAGELRELADNVRSDATTTTPADTNGTGPILRLVGTEVPAKRGA
jgi:hypothetical protein